MKNDTQQNNGLYNQIKEAYGRVTYSQTAHIKQYHDYLNSDKGKGKFLQVSNEEAEIFADTAELNFYIKVGAPAWLIKSTNEEIQAYRSGKDPRKSR